MKRRRIRSLGPHAGGREAGPGRPARLCGVIVLLAGCITSNAAAGGGKVVFFSGFDEACSLADADLDRLSGCQEAGLKLDPANADTDGDGLVDGDEVLGTQAGLDLPSMGVDPRRKNILVEYDWFVEALDPGGTGNCAIPGGHSHKPTQAALDYVTVAFAASPVSNPDGSTGIDVIHDTGQGGVLVGGNEVPAGDGIIDGGATGVEFFQYYEQYFALNRRGYFHYVLLPHRFKPYNSNKLDFSGSAQYVDGYRRDRIIVSLYCKVTDKTVGFTVMHEIGHNLGLLHGGDTICNYRPNYNSVMNYKFQFPGVDLDCDSHGDGVADYSRGLRPTIDEHSVDERKGVCGSQPIDFTNQNGIEASVAADLNPYLGELQECGEPLTVLTDHDDWGAIEIGVDASVDSGGGKPIDEAITCGE
jgi:hypothetical protein